MSRSDPWAPIAKPARGTFNARPDAGSDKIWFALDDQSRRHLLVQLDAAEPTARLITTRGLTATVDQLDPVGGDVGTWIDVACTDTTINDTFSVLASEIASAVRMSTNRRATVLDILERWLWFWSNRPGPLSDSEALGLFAELWFLHRWLNFPASLPWWRGPLGDRHDFVHRALSAEVKATAIRSDGPAKHRITHLDQLDDPVSGHLYLFSLVAVPDQLANNSLTQLVEHLTQLVAHTGKETIWSERLEASRWHPAYADRYRQPLRVVSEELYRVDENFPRITRQSFPDGQPPAGVEGVTYSIDLASVAATHRIASRPSPSDLEPMR